MNKTIVVTGGTKGIGKSIIKLFASHQFDVITCARNDRDLELLKEEIQELYPEVNCNYLKADLSIKKEVEQFAGYIFDQKTPIHVVVNNAGIFFPGQIQTEDEGVLEKTMETNLYSAYYLTRGIMKLIKEHKAHVFNICSTASITPYINGGSYCMSKYALLGFSKVLREEMKEFGVRVTSVLPGATYTASWEGAGIPEERFMKVDDVAKLLFTIYSLSENAVVEEVLLRPQLGDI